MVANNWLIHNGRQKISPLKYSKILLFEADLLRQSHRRLILRKLA